MMTLVGIPVRYAAISFDATGWMSRAVIIVERTLNGARVDVEVGCEVFLRLRPMTESTVRGAVCDSCPPSFSRPDRGATNGSTGRHPGRICDLGNSAYLPVTVAWRIAHDAGKSEA